MNVAMLEARVVVVLEARVVAMLLATEIMSLLQTQGALKAAASESRSSKTLSAVLTGFKIRLLWWQPKLWTTWGATRP
jgi:hypothetical protein